MFMGLYARVIGRVAVVLLMVCSAACGGRRDAATPTPTSTSSPSAPCPRNQIAITTGETGTLSADLAGVAGLPGSPDKGCAVVALSAETATVCVGILVREVGTVTGAHVHRRGQDAVVIDLGLRGGGSPLHSGEPLRPGQGEARNGYWGIARSCTSAEPSALSAVLAGTGAFVIDVHTAEFPAGAASGLLTR